MAPKNVPQTLWDKYVLNQNINFHEIYMPEKAWPKKVPHGKGSLQSTMIYPKWRLEVIQRMPPQCWNVCSVIYKRQRAAGLWWTGLEEETRKHRSHSLLRGPLCHTDGRAGGKQIGQQNIIRESILIRSLHC